MINATKIVKDMISPSKMRCEKCHTEITRDNFWTHKHHQYDDDKKGD